MRTVIVALALALAACGQGGVPGTASTGWQVQEVRDELTGAATQTAMLISPFDNGQVELTATCEGEQILLHYDEWGEVGPVGGTGRVVEFRMTVIAANADDTFSLSNAGTQLGLQSTVPLRASVQEGQEERLVGFVDHINSVTTQVPVAAFYGADAVSALRVEIPLLLQSATSGQPPVSQNVVVDLMPQDENLRSLLNACDPHAATNASPAAQSPEAATPSVAELILDDVAPYSTSGTPECFARDEEGLTLLRTERHGGAMIAIVGASGATSLMKEGGGSLRDGGQMRSFEGITASISRTGEAVPTDAGGSVGPAELVVTSGGATTTAAVTYECRATGQ
ncbi:MAG: hypothetical protein K2P70_17495 [Hyphomonadaceae bacterium]|nr:hypothetical protein [Hyphomonadaceae bacterium]